MQIIGLCGAARSGKDTAAEALVRHGWTRMAFADPVREGLLGVNPNVDVTALYPWLTRVTCWLHSSKVIVPLAAAVDHWGWEKLKTLPEVRGLLQRYGTEGGRDIHGFDCWIEVARRDMESVRNIANNRFVFTDVRFPNEAKFIHSRGGVVIRIERPNAQNDLHAGTESHSSEHSLTIKDWDMCLVNDGEICDLQQKVLRDVLSSLKWNLYD